MTMWDSMSFRNLYPVACLHAVNELCVSFQRGFIMTAFNVLTVKWQEFVSLFSVFLSSFQPLFFCLADCGTSSSHKVSLWSMSGYMCLTACLPFYSLYLCVYFIMAAACICLWFYCRAWFMIVMFYSSVSLFSCLNYARTAAQMHSAN